MIDAPPDVEKGPLRPHELAEAAVLADLALLCLLVARLTPFSGVAPAIAAVPIAVLASRRRSRAVVVAGVVLLVLTFLLAGFGTAQSALVALLWGAVAGVGFRRRWSLGRQLMMTVAIGWTVVASATLAVLGSLVGFRKLALDNARVQAEGFANLLRGIGLEGIGDRIVDLADTLIRWWFVAIPSFQLLISVGLALLVRHVAGPSLRRIEGLAVADTRPGDSDVPPAPVPLTVRDVVVRRSGRLVLDRVSLDVEPGTVTVVVGDNGVGKSTLLSVLAGRLDPDDGAVERPGPIGLGQAGGTAWVGQRPETQVVGSRVRDDLAWGTGQPLDEADALDALAAVGLDGWLDRDTVGASGGELQRIALAAALVRHPALLLSDESTAMIDPVGREQVRVALRAAAERGVAVVHVTHLVEDLQIADRVVRFTPDPVGPGGPS